MRALIIISLLACCSSAAAQPHADTAAAYIGTFEWGTNAGPDVERFLASVGLPVGNPWCAAFASYCLDAARPEPSAPHTRSGLASRFIARSSNKASDVLYGRYAPERGDLVIWRRGNTIYGHIGIVDDWDGACGYVIEGNTSSGIYGSQRDGDGVHRRYRCIEPGNYFRIVSFTRVVYA